MLRGGARQAQGSKIRKISYAMLEQFFAFGRFLGALGPLLRVSWLLVGVLGRFCGVRSAPGLILEGLGPFRKILKPLASFFSWVSGPRVRAFRTSSRCAKT